ncbi:MAG: Ku protein [Gemmobacter sp.]|nr:Ku protein [Gemmobacter sp.]
MRRAIWKGYLVIGAVTCPVALHAAASTAERVSFHTLNRKTGNRVKREFIDSETGAPVAREDQVKGYETAPGQFLHLTEEDIAASVPESDKALKVDRFVPCADVDTVYLDRPYYLTPASPGAGTAYALIRDGLAAQGVAALARTVLFRRLRTMLIRVNGDALVGSTLNYVDEVRPAADVFAEVRDITLKDEMVKLARHIIETKAGEFDPAEFDDRYDAALADLVKAKIEGRKITPRPAPRPRAGGDLLAALRESAGVAAKPAKRAASKDKSPEGKTPAAKARPARKAG